MIPLGLALLASAGLVGAAAPAGSRGGLPDMAFVQAGRDCSEIRTMRADGTRVRRVVPCRFGVQSPDWSPDGQRLLFVDSEEGGQWLYVVRLDGSGRRRVATGNLDVSDPAWSPDGRRIAYASGGSLFVAGADGTARRRVARALENLGATMVA